MNDQSRDENLFGDWQNTFGLASGPAADAVTCNGQLRGDWNDQFGSLNDPTWADGMGTADLFLSDGDPFGLSNTEACPVIAGDEDRFLDVEDLANSKESNNGYGDGSLDRPSGAQPRRFGGAGRKDPTALKAGPLQDFLAQLESGTSTPFSGSVDDGDGGVYPGALTRLAATPGMWSRSGTPMSAGPSLDVEPTLSSDFWGDGAVGEPTGGYTVDTSIPSVAAPKQIPAQPNASVDSSHTRTSHKVGPTNVQSSSILGEDNSQPPSALGQTHFQPSAAPKGLHFHPSVASRARRGIPSSDSDSEGLQERSARGRKRKASYEDYNRVVKARRRCSVPRYPVKTTKDGEPQIKAVEWLISKARRTFEETYTALLASWGVQRHHRGTCLLVAGDWHALDPLVLMDYFSAEKCPATNATRLAYRYADHNTTFARTVAWFSEWPRHGIELDNFISCGPFKAKDASHLCHHDQCVVHIVYEGADKNQDRKQCHEAAQFLRTERRPIPAACELHDPPCLLQVSETERWQDWRRITADDRQHASLTTLEAYGIQFATLAMARGRSLGKPLRRPQRHRYSTFEATIPLSSGFDAIVVDLAQLSSGSVAAAAKGKKPDMMCTFCTRHKLKGFSSVVQGWRHIYRTHDDVDDTSRLKEMKRMAKIWAEYQEKCYPQNMKGTNKTWRMVQQLIKIDASWDTVREWDLA